MLSRYNHDREFVYLGRMFYCEDGCQDVMLDGIRRVELVVRPFRGLVGARRRRNAGQNWTDKFSCFHRICGMSDRGGGIFTCSELKNFGSFLLNHRRVVEKRRMASKFQLTFLEWRILMDGV